MEPVTKAAQQEELERRKRLEQQRKDYAAPIPTVPLEFLPGKQQSWWERPCLKYKEKRSLAHTVVKGRSEIRSWPLRNHFESFGFLGADDQKYLTEKVKMGRPGWLSQLSV